MDDSLFFGKATLIDTNSLKQILITYEYETGQQINFKKSRHKFSQNMPQDIQVML